jgi:hypothetical protein
MGRARNRQRKLSWLIGTMCLRPLMVVTAAGLIRSASECGLLLQWRPRRELNSLRGRQDNDRMV